MADQTGSILIVFLLAAAGAGLSGCAEPADANHETDDDSHEYEFYPSDFGLIAVPFSEPICKFWVPAWTTDIISDGGWTGECKKGLAQGNGALTVQLDAKNPGSITYIGSLKNGYMDGYGSLMTVKYSDAGDRYTEVYSGFFVAGDKTGLGHEYHVSRDTDGSNFETDWSGDFIKGELSGRGRLLSKRRTADRVERTELKNGKFSNHFLNGPGIETITTLSASGAIQVQTYKGQWEKGNKSGLGVLVESNSGTSPPRRYLGKWSHGRRDGPGVQYFGPEDYFKGNWKHGAPILGYCELRSENYSGPCQLYEYDSSYYSGVRCLAAQKGQKYCLEAWRSEWIS